MKIFKLSKIQTNLIKLGFVLPALVLTSASYANSKVVHKSKHKRVKQYSLEEVKKAKIHPILPVINTTKKSSYIKANILNPFPVCNSGEDARTVIYKVSDKWLPVGTISTYNQTNGTIPLTQTTSKSQTISITVNGSKTSSISGNFGGKGGISKGGASAGADFGIAFSLAKQIGGKASYSLSWNIGQTIGPYKIPAGHTGDATYGFRAVFMKGTRQFCLANGTWSTPRKWLAFVPVKNEVRVKLYKSLAGSIDKNQKPNTHYIAPVPKPANIKNIKKPTSKLNYDLQPYMTVSSSKVPGFAGATALHVKNVGNKNYYGEYPVVSFLVEVKTAKGPKHVGRIVKTSWFKGAYVQDLGFNRKNSTHSYLVTLSNQINKGKDVKLASFNFYDGKTKVGRLKNYIRISQIGRIKGDNSYYNDTLIDSRKTTKDDFGNLYGGLF